MKLKKGDVYKWRTSPQYFEVVCYVSEFSHQDRLCVKFPLGYTMVYQVDFLTDLIKSGQLVKIPQLYK